MMATLTVQKYSTVVLFPTVQHLSEGNLYIHRLLTQQPFWSPNFFVTPFLIDESNNHENCSLNNGHTRQDIGVWTRVARIGFDKSLPRDRDPALVKGILSELPDYLS
jgi:hypothetical protein